MKGVELLSKGGDPGGRVNLLECGVQRWGEPLWEGSSECNYSFSVFFRAGMDLGTRKLRTLSFLIEGYPAYQEKLHIRHHNVQIILTPLPTLPNAFELTGVIGKRGEVGGI